MEDINITEEMANRGALILLLLIIIMKICTTMGTLVESKAEPVQYISFPPNTYDRRPYNVTHNIGNCTSSRVRIDNIQMNEEVITCPYGELLLDGITQTNLEDDVTNNDIQTFYTWQDNSIPLNDEAFVTLQFPNNIIIPTKVVVYVLDMKDFRAREPSDFKLYYSSTESIFPDNEIRDVDDKCVVVKSGRTSENEYYEYIRCDLTINGKVSLNYLLIELDFGFSSWIFLSEIEVYHLVPLPTTTSLTTTSSSDTSSTMSSITITSSSYRTSSSVTSTSRVSSSTVFATITPTIMSDTMSPVSASSSTKSLSLTVSTTIIVPTTTTVAAIVPSNDNDDDSASVVVISVAVAVTGTSLLIIILLLVVIMLAHRRRKKSRKLDNVDDNKDVTIKMSSNEANNDHNRQQHTHNTTDQSQHDFSDNYMLPQGAKASRLETANNLYISTKVKSLDSLLREQHDHNRSISGCDVIMTANPSYVTSTSSLQTRKKSEQEYDHARTDGGLVKHDEFGYLQLVEPAKVTDPTSDNIYINVKPSY